MRERLLVSLAARVGADGAVRDGCRSRVLESVVALRLLERTGHDARAAEALRTFLRSRTPVTGAERVLAAAVLDGQEIPTGGLFVEAVTAAAPGFTAVRKRALVHALAVMADETFVPEWDETGFGLSGLHSWAIVQVTAVKVILACAAGRVDRVGDEDVRLLLDTQRRPHVWEGNVLIHLSVLHALSRLPGTGAVVADGIRRALAHQRTDGGLPFVSDTDTWCTATAGVALASAGAPRRVLDRMAGHLVERQQPGGGWSYTDVACQTDVDDTSVAVQFLHLVDDVLYREPITCGLRSLVAVAGPDGGFPTYVAGAPSEASMTAAVVDALTVRPAAHTPLITGGLRYLAGQQQCDGSFPPDWSSSRLHTVFRVLLAAGRPGGGQSPRVRRMVERGRNLVLSQQNADGGWGQQTGEPSDVISTAYGLIAVCGQADPAPAVAAASYLATAQGEGGSQGMRPDSIGPRPFVFTVPALADIFTLLALSHLTGRTVPVRDGVEGRLAGAR
ncbi:terpene cyclase/mutase family protein [Streptomyces sp. NBC_00237]|uniref:prenyltransferase/squalene oxidase repeat-containing protein n=1 Tax=Streptomyces sp. NBC_00237 TaxID=2975687 RepID=UPI00225AD181|nr:prenyltransferase/squalene oxidase repeat-containing protein [Streptomyces sp. NBC_00237]MCX5205571.1 terpene cyclase/mutase family protein [Streptomyces sp. NBC_00237]